MSDVLKNIYAPPQSQSGQRSDGNTSGLGKLYEVPPEIPGWSWGAFCLNWIWGASNRTWIGLAALFPFLGLIVAIVLGAKGREWAWRNKRWDSIEHFNRVQRLWSIWGLCLWLIPILGIVAAFAIPEFTRPKPSQADTMAYMYCHRMAKHVGAYIINHRSLPATMAEAGASEAPPAGVRSIVFNRETAQIEVSLDGQTTAGPAFYLAPSWDAEGYINWTCLRGSHARERLPAGCRKTAADPFRI